MQLPKIIVILGPTASGKTDASLRLAKKFNGEIVSADSRQIYKKMDIGTAKPKADFGLSTLDFGRQVYVVDGIPHHLMNIIDPGEDFSLADYKKLALSAINDVLSREKLPIIVGGTGLYIRAIVDNLDIPKVGPNKQLRRQLGKKKLPELAEMLAKMDPATAKKIDLRNPRRVLRALEVFILSGKSFARQRTKSAPLFNALRIGIDLPRADLFKRIDYRVDEQIKNGLVKETENLVKQKYGWNLPSMSGIGYKQIGLYLRGEDSLDKAVAALKRDTRRYAKRQMTWFGRDKKIKWIKSYSAAEKLAKEFLKKK
jgi:tRNA dimethylallyltransferase